MTDHTELVVRRCRFAFLVVAALILASPVAEAQNRLGGHFGAVFPLFTRAGGETTTISEDFQIGFPMGITIKKPDAQWAFDLELVPGIQNEPLGVSLTVHPGVLFSVREPWTAGIRMAFDVNAASWGFTPLLNYGFPNGHGLFVEAVLPIRFQENFLGNSQTAVGFGVHVGVGF